MVIIFITHNLKTFKYNTLIKELLLIQFYLFILFVLICITRSDENYASHCLTSYKRRNMHTLFSVYSLRDDNVITSKPRPYTKNEVYANKLYSRLF